MIDDVISAWVQDQESKSKGKKRDIPDFEDVKKIIEESFWASIKREEEQSLTFCVTLLSKREYHKELTKSGVAPLVIPFLETVEFSSKSIAKLANSFEKSNSSIAVWKNENGEYKIWGSLFFNSIERALTQIPVAVENNIYFRPDVISVTAISPGSLIISRSNGVIGRIENGSFTRAIPTPFNGRALIKYLKRLAPFDIDNKTFQINSHLTNVIKEILVYLEENSHGASLLIVPDRETESIKKICKIKYEIQGDYQLSLLLQRAHLDSQKMHSVSHSVETMILNVGYNKAILNRIKAIARLACIDGALVITNTLRVIGFGATLQFMQPWNGRVLIAPDGFNPYVEKTFLWQNYGTRHSSMVNYIGESSTAVGFVISQDGPIRAFAKYDDETLYCWPDCRVSMFI